MIRKILNREPVNSIAYAPNYWQWFSHHFQHNTLPDEIRHFQNQLDIINYLGLEVFSRNIYCDQQRVWFGGLAHQVLGGVVCSVEERIEGKDRVFLKTYNTSKGALQERLRYVYAESTLVQEKFLVGDYVNQIDTLRELIESRRWQFDVNLFKAEQKRIGTEGVIIAGEVCSPLKLLHLVAGPIDTVYLLTDLSNDIEDILITHERAQLELIEQMVSNGVQVVMAMDNLDSTFHTPHYVESYSASFYEKASDICHKNGSLFFIHACGRQHDNLKLISSLGVDGLEGVAYPPFGDIELDDVMRLVDDDFIITGGISAAEIRELKTKDEVFDYVRKLFERMRMYANRFILSSSCNTPIDTTWETIKWFRDAWLQYKQLD